ncbi:hypothetical protein Hdeb2414_s0016g00470771 [Helianthus debilis subsp. tardiflorus]
MSPTVSAANKASLPKKKILGERNNETLDAVEQHFGSKPVKCDSDDDVERDFVGLKPYDPVKNYLSPRPKFLRYNPDRRRKILSLRENVEDRVEVSTDFDAGIPELQDSCSGQESVEEARDVSSESEDESGDDEEEMGECVEDRCCSVKGFFKFVFVVIALVLMTQAICSMNTPLPSQNEDSVLGFNASLNHVYGLSLSEVVYGPIREPVFLVERMKEGNVYDDGIQDVSATSEEFVADEAENDDSDEVLREEENKTSEVVETEYVDAETVDDSNQNEKNHQLTNNEILQEDETEATEVVDRDYVEAETVDGDVTEEDDGKDHQLTNDVEFETANEMEDGVENELDDDAKTNDVLVKVTSFDLTIAILLGHVLVLTSFGAIYRSRCKKVEKEELQATEPSTKPQSVIEEQNEASLFVPPQQNDVSKEVNHVHIPSVELLGEFVFGEETTTSSNMSPEVQTTAVSSSQTETSHTVKKQRRKNAEVVTPSSVSVRRSSRLKTRSSVMSP